MEALVPNFPWGHHRRFHAHAMVMKNMFGARVQKLTVDAGFTCPNRDGTLGTGGCSFCDNMAFNPSYCSPEKDIRTQLLEGIAFHANRYRRASAYLAYFQAYTNTYAPISVLEKRFGEALSIPQIKGLVIGTRPDCLGDEVMALLVELSKQTRIFLELGVESFYDRSLVRINRGHDAAVSIDAIRRAAAHGIHTAVHLIFGLPGESSADMLAQARMLSSLPVNSVKIHQLQVFKGTALEMEIIQNPDDFNIFTLEGYIDLVIEFLEHLSPAISVERLAAEAPPRFLAMNPFGVMRYYEVLRRIEARMEELNTFQGRLFYH